MKRLILIAAMVLTCVLAAVANLLVERVTTLNVFSFKVWVIVPVGAVLVGALGASGFVVAARLFNIKPKLIDFVPAIAIAAGTMVLIYYLDYVTFVLDDGRKVSDLISFSKYVDILVTTAHMRVGRAAVDTGEVGQFGYALAAVEFIGFLVGGVVPLAFAHGMPTCASCDTYLRKLKTVTTKVLTPDESARLLQLFEESNLETMRALLAWQPEERTLGKDANKVVLTYSLYGCPKCTKEAIMATAKVFSGGEWREIDKLKRRRNLASETSLRESFT